MFKINLSNPFIFWLIVAVLTIFVLLFNTFSITKTVQEAPIQEQSLSKKQNDYIIDLDKIESAKKADDFIYKKDVEELSFSKRVEAVASLENFYTLLYGFIVSVLFVYRERQNRNKDYKIEKLEDELNIQKAKQQTTVYKDIVNELEKYNELIKHDINLNALNERIEHEPKYVVIASKNIIEQIVTKMYKKYLSLENANLNIMLTDLYRSRKLGHDTNNYAHIIKAFGNKANHTGKVFDSREAMLTISNLIEFLKELDKKGILGELNG